MATSVIRIGTIEKFLDGDHKGTNSGLGFLCDTAYIMVGPFMITVKKAL